MCNTQVAPADCTSDGKRYLTCNSCRRNIAEKQRAARAESVSNPEDLPPDEIIHETAPEGITIETHEPNEFDHMFDDMDLLVTE